MTPYSTESRPARLVKAHMKTLESGHDGWITVVSRFFLVFSMRPCRAYVVSICNLKQQSNNMNPESTILTTIIVVN